MWLVVQLALITNSDNLRIFFSNGDRVKGKVIGMMIITYVLFLLAPVVCNVGDDGVKVIIMMIIMMKIRIMLACL